MGPWARMVLKVSNFDSHNERTHVVIFDLFFLSLSRGMSNSHVETRGAGVEFENQKHEMRGPAGTGRGGVSMAGGRQGQGAGMGNGVVACHHRHVLFGICLSRYVCLEY